MTVKRTITQNEVTGYEEMRITQGPKGFQLTAKEVKTIREFFEEPSTFDGVIACTEEVIKPDLPEAGSMPDPLSRPWYALQIQDRIAAVRAFIERGDPDQVAVAALALGILLMEAKASIRWNEDLGLGRTIRRNNRAAGKAGAAERRKTQAILDTRLLREVRACRKRDPHISRRAIASKLLPTFGADARETAEPRSTTERVRLATNALDRKILRLEKKSVT